MKDLVNAVGNESLPSIVKDPFILVKVQSIHVHFIKSTWSRDNGKFNASGTVAFKNGNTEGKQNFEGDTFDEVVLKIRVFLEQLKQKSNES